MYQTVSMKRCSVRLKRMTAKNITMQSVTKLYPKERTSKVPAPRKEYLKVSKMGVSGLMLRNILYCSGAKLKG